MELVNTSVTYEEIYKEAEEDLKPIFYLRKLTTGDIQNIQDSTSLLDSKDRIQFQGGTTSKLKIKFSLVSWKNIFVDGKEVECNDANKEKLPPEVSSWLVKRINKLNKLDGISEDERKN